MLLDQINTYLPHILYGVDGAHASARHGDRVSDAALLPGMIVEAV